MEKTPAESNNALPSTNITIQSATAEDLPALLTLLTAAYAQYDGWLDPPSGAHAESIESLGAKLAKGSAARALINSEIVGSVFFEPRPGYLYLGRLAVSPAHRRLGIGRLLVEYVEAQARALNLPLVRLGVRLAIPENLNYYLRLGYRIAGQAHHPGYAWPTSVDMEKQILPWPRQIQVVPHDPTWKEQAKREVALLENVFGPELIAIHHIGSTTIATSNAKPIIDLLPEVRNIRKIDAFNLLLMTLGYEPKGENGIPGRRYFVKGGDLQRSHQVHVFETGNPEIARHLNFCAYLNAHPEEAQVYSQLKQALVQQYPNDMLGYTQGKSTLIRQIDAKATAWRKTVAERVQYQIDAMQPEDWEQVRAIYLEGIATGHATFETEAPSWETWDAGRLPHCRLVARSGDWIVGWAVLSPTSSRQVYAGVTEVSLYVGKQYRGIGVGRTLLTALIKGAESRGIWSMQAGIFPENQASIILHKRCGFREVGRRERIGQMNGAWRDVVLLERRCDYTAVGQDL